MILLSSKQLNDFSFDATGQTSLYTELVTFHLFTLSFFLSIPGPSHVVPPRRATVQLAIDTHYYCLPSFFLFSFFFFLLANSGCSRLSSVLSLHHLSPQPCTSDIHIHVLYYTVTRRIPFSSSSSCCCCCCCCCTVCVYNTLYFLLCFPPLLSVCLLVVAMFRRWC